MVKPNSVVRFAPSPTGLLHVDYKLLPLIGRAKASARLSVTRA